MNYLTNLFGGGNAAGGMRMPQMGTGMDLYGGKPSMNLGMTMQVVDEDSDKIEFRVGKTQ